MGVSHLFQQHAAKARLGLECLHHFGLHCLLHTALYSSTEIERTQYIVLTGWYLCYLDCPVSKSHTMQDCRPLVY